MNILEHLLILVNVYLYAVSLKSKNPEKSNTVFMKIWSSVTVFIIDNKKKSFQISIFESFLKDHVTLKTGCWKLSFAIKVLNHTLNIYFWKVILNCSNISEHICFYCIFIR